MTDPAPKPPPQIAGVVGIDARPITLASAPVDWSRVSALPAFQMYAFEQTGGGGEDALLHARAFVAARGAGADLWDAYAAWHHAKGCWPGEDPMGALKGRSL